MAGVLHTSRQRVCGQQRCIIQPPCVTCLPQLGHILALLPQASTERRIADSALLRLPGPGSVRRRPYSRLWVPSRVVEGFGLSPGVRVWVVSARGSLPRWAAGAPARCREPARRAWVLLLTALRWCWRRSAWSPGRPARVPARRRRAEASWGPGLPGITAAGAAGHRGHALVFGTAACVASAAPGG
jgi:hypothetical protein